MDERDRYPGNLPHLLRQQEQHLQDKHEGTPDNTPEVAPVSAPLAVQGNAKTPRRSRWRLWLLPAAYLLLSTATCTDLVLAPDSRSSGAPVVAGQSPAVTAVSHARSGR